MLDLGARSDLRGSYFFVYYKPTGDVDLGISDILGKSEGIDAIVALEFDVADADLQRVAAAVTVSDLQKAHPLHQISGGWHWGFDSDLKVERVRDDQYNGLADFVRDYLINGKKVHQLQASQILTELKILIEAKGGEERETKPYQPTEEEIALFQRFDELRQGVIDRFTRTAGNEKWFVPLYRDGEGNGFHIDGEGNIGVKFDMSGYDAGRCTPEKVWEQYRNHLKRDDLTRKQAVEMAIIRFEEILSH